MQNLIENMHITKEAQIMHEYEIIIVELNPCGGEEYANRTILEAEAESPEAYVKENGRFPILERMDLPDGSVQIITGNGHGYFVRYHFTE